jgi:serine/threonine-protein kinase
MTTPRLLSNRYELGDVLGYGGMSEVHGGKDVRLGRDVAVKVLRADLARDPQFQLRFRREAQNAASLNHPAIVAVYDTGETQVDNAPLPYIVMEYVDGRTLRDMVKTEGPLPPRRAMEIMADVCAALDFSHRNGIVHRDVKPANVMVTQTGAVKVMDFGIARAMADGQAVTQTAAVIGTAQYLSPEQARGEVVDARSDVYAAGCVLFELVTGEPPFTGDSPVAVAYQHVREDPRAPSAVNPRIGPEVDAIVLKAMSKNRDNRYQSAAEMRGDLVRVLNGQRPVAPLVMTDADRTSMLADNRPTDLFPGRHRPEALRDDQDQDAAQRRRKWLIALVAVLAVAVIGAAVAIAANLGGTKNPNANKIAVPDVVGQPQANANNALASAGLSVKVNQVQSDIDQLGKVVTVDPATGTMVDKGSLVTLNVGRGPDQVPVPDLTNMTPDQAAAALQAVGLTLSPTQDSKPVDDPNQVGKVLTQAPAPGQQVAVQTAVRITVGSTQNKVTMINVVGEDYDTAASNLQNIGLQVTRNDVSSATQQGQVIAQDQKAGSKVSRNTTVTLSVSKGDQLQMPDLTGLSKGQAQQKLQGMGWNGQLVEADVTGQFNQLGKIIDQQPTAGSQLTNNQTVQIQVVTKFGNGGGPTTTTTTTSTSQPPGGGG